MYFWKSEKQPHFSYVCAALAQQAMDTLANRRPYR